MGPDRDRRRRHARADPAGAQRRPADDRDRASRRRASSTSRLQRMAADWPGLEGMDLAKDVSRLQVERWIGGKWAWGAGLSSMGGDDATAPACRRGRLWLEAQHLPQPGRGRRAGDGRAGDRDLRRDHGARARRLLPVERAGRSGGDGRICGAGDPADAGDRRSRCSASASATRCSRSRSAGRRQDVPGPPRRQPPGQAARRRRGRDHQHEPRLRGRARGHARPCARNARVAVRRDRIAGSS